MACQYWPCFWHILCEALNKLVAFPIRSLLHCPGWYYSALSLPFSIASATIFSTFSCLLIRLTAIGSIKMFKIWISDELLSCEWETAYQQSDQSRKARGQFQCSHGALSGPQYRQADPPDHDSFYCISDPINCFVAGLRGRQQILNPPLKCHPHDFVQHTAL